MIEVSEDEKESSKTLEYKYFEAYQKTYREPRFELKIDFPWKRLIFWGLFTFFYLTSYSQNLDFSEKVGSLLLLMWIAGLIIPDILLTIERLS